MIQRISVLFFLCGSIFSNAQSDADSDRLQNLWNRVEARLDVDTTASFLLEWVEETCEEQIGSCYYDTGNYLIRQLESQRFDLPRAIYLSEQLLNRATRENDARRQLFYNDRLYVYTDALHLKFLSRRYNERAFELANALGDSAMVDRQRIIGIEDQISLLGLDATLAEIALYEGELQARNARSVLARLYYRLQLPAYQNGSVALLRKMEAYYREYLIEQEIKQPPNIKHHRATLAEMRADLAELEGNIPVAIAYLRQSRSHRLDLPDHWRATDLTHKIARLELQRGRLDSVWVHIAAARARAEAHNIFDLLVENFELERILAERTNDFVLAYRAQRDVLRYDSILQERAGGFDLENYYLIAERERLRAVADKQLLELELSTTQRRILFGLVVLGVLLIGLLVYGYWYQRRSKRTLAARNALIREQRDRIRQDAEQKTHFFANISHELRTPLTLLLGPLGSLLKSKHLSTDETELLRMAQRNGVQLRNLVNEVLQLSRLEAGQGKVAPEIIHGREFFLQHAALFEAQAQIKELDFTVLIEDESERPMLIDPAVYRQILNNLLSNAFKFTPPGGRVELRVTILEAELNILVSDTGRGIHREELERLFDRFYQSTHARRDLVGGSGIGLALVREYTELMNGTIRAESEPGEGSRFFLTLPVERTHAPVPPARGPHKITTTEASLVASSGGSPSRAARVLVVEDHSDLRRYLSKILGQQYQVLTAENGRAALDLLRTERIDLMLSDVMMPEMDGYALLKVIKADARLRTLPVVMLTARAADRDRFRALRMGVDDYLTKPFAEEELLVRIENLLRNARQRAAYQRETPTEPGVREVDREWLAEVEATVSSHISSGVLSVSNLANTLHMSESALLRRLKSLTGLTTAKYLTEVRLNLARTHLERGTYRSVSEVAREVGYADFRTFSRNYKARFGRSPSEMLRN